MAEKISTIILKVDLDCRSCYKKISKAVCKLQEREKIQTVAFDEKNNTVTISGPFDIKKLIKKLCCKAGDVIKDIQIKENKEKEKEKPKETKPAEPKKDKPKDTKPDEKPKEEPKKDKPKDTKPEEKPKEEPKKDKPKDTKPADKPKDDPKTDKPKTLEPNPPPPEPKSNPVPVVQKPEPGFQPVWPGPVCSCGCRPWYEGYYGSNKCPWCGRGFGWQVAGPPPVAVLQPVAMWGAPPAPCGYKTCEFFYEEDPQSSCRVM